MKLPKKNRYGVLALAITQLAISYGFASLAIDRGNFIWYLLCLILLVIAVKNLYKSITNNIYGKHKAN